MLEDISRVVQQGSWVFDGGQYVAPTFVFGLRYCRFFRTVLWRDVGCLCESGFGIMCNCSAAVDSAVSNPVCRLVVRLCLILAGCPGLWHVCMLLCVLMTPQLRSPLMWGFPCRPAADCMQLCGGFGVGFASRVTWHMSAASISSQYWCVQRPLE